MSIDLGSAHGSIVLKTDGVTRGVAAAVAALRSFEAQTAGAGKNLDQIGQAGERVGAQVAKGTAQATQSIQKLAQTTQDVSGSFDKLGGAAGLAGAALVAGLGVAVKGAADLETSVAKISTIKPNINVGQLGDEIQAVSQRVAQSSGQIASGLYNIFSSVEVSQAQALDLVTQFSKGAVAAQTDAETFGTAILGSLSAYGAGTEQAAKFGDVFFATVRDGVISGDQLAHVLGTVSKSAATAGISFDQLGALIAASTKSGGDAAENVNSLRQAIEKLTSVDVSKQLGAMGIATTDANGKFRDIIDVLGDLDQALAKLSQSERAATLTKLFPDQQARQGIITLLPQLEAIRKGAEDNAKAAGVAESAYQKMGNTAAAQAQILKNTLLNTVADAGQIALPGLVDVAKKVQGLVQAFNDLSPSTKGFIVSAAEIAAVTLLIGSGSIKAISSVVQLATALKTLATAIKSIEGATALSALGTSAGVAVVALPLVAIAAGNIKNEMDDADEAIQKVAKSLSGDLANAISKVQGANGLEAFTQLFTGQSATAERAAKAVHDWAEGIGGAIPTLEQLRTQMEIAGKATENFNKMSGQEAQTRLAVLNALIAEVQAREELNRLEAIRNRMLTSEAESSFTPPPSLVDVGKGQAAAAAALAATALAARGLSDAASTAADATDKLLTKFKQTEASLLAQKLAEIGGAMGQVQSATAPLGAALDALNAKRAAGLPLTQQESSLLQQIPGYLGQAASATNALAVVQAQLAIDAINAAGGIDKMGGQFTGATGPAGGLAGRITELTGALLALQSAQNALSAEDAQLTGLYNTFKARVDVLEGQKKEKGFLSPADQAELDDYNRRLGLIGTTLGENAAKERDYAKAIQDGLAARKEAARVEAEQKAASEKAVLQDPFRFKEDRRVAVGPDLAPPPVPVPLEPAVDPASLAAVRQILGQPVNIPVKVDLQGLGGGAVKGALGIAESMGLSTSGLSQTINVTANTGAAETAIQTVQDRLVAINNTPTLATLNAQDNASAVANAVAEAVKRIPEIHATEVNAVDNASGPLGGILGTINSIPTSFSITANVDISGALANIQALSNQIPRSPAKEGPFKQLPNWSALYESLVPAGDDAVLSIQDTTQRMAVAIGDGIDAVTSESAKSAAELASIVAGAVSAATDALGKLRSFRAPDPAQFTKLRDALLPVVDLFAQDAIARGDGTKAAGDYAEQLGKIVGAVGVGVDALAKLRDFQRPTDRAVSDFRDVSQYLVNVILQVAHDTDTDLTEAGATYAEAAGKIYASVGTGVDTLTKLQRFKRPTDKAVTDFRDVSQFLVNVIAQVAADIEDQALPKAGDWADAAGKIFSAVGTGVDALTKLQSFERPTDQAVNSFRDVSQYAVNLIAQVAADIEDQALPKASQWADTALKIFQAIGSGVDGLSKLEGFERPTDQALRSFRDVTQLAVNLIAEAAATISEDALTDAATYADAAGKVVSLIGQGVESFAKLATGDLQLPDNARLQAFAAKTAEAVVALAAAAATVDTKAVAAAGTYSEGAGKTVALVGQGVEGFSKLATFTAPTAGQIRAFSAAVSATVIAIAQAAKGISADAVAAAGEYSDGAGKAVSLLGSAVSAFKALGDKDFILPSKEGIDGVVYLAQYATDRLIGIGHSYGNGDLNQLKAFADAASSGFGAIRGALDAGKGLADPDRIKPADAIGTVLAEFQAGLAPLGALATLSQTYKTQGEIIGANIAQAYAAIAAGLPGFTAQSQAATASVSVNTGQTITHRFDGEVRFNFLAENGTWIVKSLQVDDSALTATSDLIAGKLLPIFEAAIEEA